MAEHFPEGKSDRGSVSMSVEKAIFEWSIKTITGVVATDESLEDKSPFVKNEYWERVHSIVAGVTGMRDAGPLMQCILDGDFATPKSLVELPREVFDESFEGKSIDLTIHIA